MSVDHADSASRSLPPAPRFGLVHSHAASLVAPRIGLPAWQPPAELGAPHRPALATSLPQRVLARVREPVQHLVVDGLPAIYVAGISLLIREPDGCMRGWLLAVSTRWPSDRLRPDSFNQLIGVLRRKPTGRHPRGPLAGPHGRARHRCG